MSNLHDKRFYRTENPDTDWNFVAVPNLYHPAQVKGSVDTSGYYVRLVGLALKPSEKTGVPPKRDVLTFRGSTIAELKRNIQRVFPQSVFSLAQISRDTLREGFYAEQKAEREQKAAVEEQKAFEGLVVEQHRKIERECAPAEQEQAARTSLSLFATDPQYSSAEWVAWFRQRIGFFSWHDNSWKNRETILKFCRQRGQLVPRTEEIAQAMNYLLQRGHFYLKPTYKRSERDELAAVKPFEREVNPVDEISQAQVHAAVKALSGKFGMPLQVSIERLEACGIPNPEAMFAAIQKLYSAEPVQEKSSAELKADLQTMRNSARGNRPRPRIENMQGY